jgi:negative regulator of flagellin synthesis FlgM
MGINSINSQPAQQTDALGEQAGVQRTERQHHGQRASQTQASQGGDTLEVSARGRELAKAQQAVEDAPDVRADRVADIKQRIADGTYNVPADVLARKLLGDK